MAAPDLLLRSVPGFSLPAFDRLAPPPPPEIIAAKVEAHSAPGDVVVDLFGRGGWVARSALDRQRRACSFESTPLTRLLAEVVLRPPDIRHLDAAFQVISASPHGTASLKSALGELFSSRCATCDRVVVIDEVIWEGETAGRRDGHPIRKHYRCTICRDQVGGGEQRNAPVDEADRVRAAELEERSPAWLAMHDRFPILDGNNALVDQLLALHTPRQLIGLYEILQRIDGDLRAAPVEAALRLALLQGLLPATRLNGFPGRIANLRIVGGRVKLPSSGQWRERNPWLAFEDGFRLVRGFVQRLENVPSGVVQARFREDLRSLSETPSAVLVRMGTPAAVRSLAAESGRLSGAGPQPRVRLVLGQPPLRPSQDRLSYSYFASAWILGYEATSTLPLAPLFHSSAKLRWGWQAAQLQPSLEAVQPLLTRDARVILNFDEGGPEALVATVLGAIGAGYRLIGAQLDERPDAEGGLVEFVAPGGSMPSGPRTRANVALPPLPGGAGDTESRRGRGLFSAPERLSTGPFSPAEAARAVSETAVEILQARGEPAGYDRLLGEILVGLDRAGHLRRLIRSVGAAGGLDGPRGDKDRNGPLPRHAPSAGPAVRRTADPNRDPDAAATPPTEVAHDGTGGAWNEAMDRLLALVRQELARPDHRRLSEIEPGSWWLTDRDDRSAAALPLADRVEWAVFSLLSTAGRLSEATLFERIGSMFTGHDQPDEGLIRACVDSYRSMASTPGHLFTAEDLPKRSQEHVGLVATLTEIGHRLGMQAWIGLREQSRTLQGRRLSSWLDERELRVNLTAVARAPQDELELVPCIWYVRSKVAFTFELEWTGMVGEPILRRHARIPPSDRLVRFLVIVPERTELVRYKLARSPLLRQSMQAGNWHILKSNHVRALAERERITLEDLEPLLGLDPPAERRSEQIPLFG